MSKPIVSILAAGKGTRLGDATTELPKCLLDVGGRTILDRQLESLRACSVADEDIRIVTGHAADRICELYEGRIPLIYNDHYDDFNNIYSVHLLRDLVGCDMLLINGDTLFHRSILEGLLECQDAATLAVDTTKQLGEEEMKLIYEDGRLVRIGKDLDPATSTGEYIGLLRMRNGALDSFFDAIAEMIAAGRVHDWYEGAINSIAQTVEIGLTETSAAPWVEIDTPEDRTIAAGMIAALDVAGQEGA